MLNNKKQTVIREEGSTHKRNPTVKRPKSAEAAGNAAHCKRGKNVCGWKSKEEGENSVSQWAWVTCDENVATNSF
jgi:hypothetical protein